MYRKITVALILMIGAIPAVAAERKISMHIDNMTCATCPIIARTAVGNVEGVRSVEVDLATKTAVVVFDDSVASATQLEEASRNADFPAMVEE